MDNGKTKVGIITYHNGSNYGAALQTFALQHFLSSHGYDTKIINYKNRFIMQGLDRIRWGFSLHHFYYILCDLLNFKNNGRKIKSFYKFFNEFYCLTELMDKNALKSTDLGFDCILSGSDQIWNPLLNNGFDDIYFGEIANPKRRLSYSSSCGAYDFSNDIYNKELAGYLEKYEKVSVREKAKEISEVVNRRVEEVCDPTLLLGKDEWLSALNLVEAEEDYLLIYALCDFEKIIGIAKRIAKEMRLRAVFIGNMLKKEKGISYCSGIGPKEFVELFSKAKFVVTNSFHGTAFSVNFKKDFFSVVHPSSPERAITLLRKIGLESRLIENAGFGQADYRVDYDGIDSKLDSLKKESKEYLLSI